MHTQHDDSIIARLRACDAEGLAQIESSRKTECLKFVYKHLAGSRAGKDLRYALAEIQELWQEALVRVYEMFCLRKAHLTCKLTTLINTILRNIWVSEIRKSGKQAMLGDIAQDEPGVPTEAVRQWVRIRLEAMAEPCRTMLILRYYYCLDYDGVAELMGYHSGDVVRNLISRCRKAFREQFPLNWDQLEEQPNVILAGNSPKPQHIDPSQLPPDPEIG